MDRGSLCVSVCALIVCLLGAASCSATDENGCLCAEIPRLHLTKPPPETCLSDMFRYTCADGYVRKAGTSNLIKCKRRGNGGTVEWTKPSLTCIPDPLRTTTLPPNSPVTAAATEPQTTRSGKLSTAAASHTRSTAPTSPGSQQGYTLPSNDLAYPVVPLSETTERTVESEALNQTTAAPPRQASGNSTDRSHASTHTTGELGKTTTALIICASLVLVCAVIGSSYVLYRRRSRHKKPEATEEEQMSMSAVPPGTAAF